MKNTIVVSVVFYFKGEKYAPSLTIDLDDYVSSGRKLQSIYIALAEGNDIGLYTYEYEMMESEALVYSQASGLAVDFLAEGKFDFAGFQQALQKEIVLKGLSAIASQHLAVSDLSNEPGLKAALYAAHKLGQEAD